MFSIAAREKKFAKPEANAWPDYKSNHGSGHVSGYEGSGHCNETAMASQTSF
jgi:hypothetical protein